MPLVMGMPVGFFMGMKKKHISVIPNGIAYCYCHGHARIYVGRPPTALSTGILGILKLVKALAVYFNNGMLLFQTIVRPIVDYREQQLPQL